MTRFSRRGHWRTSTRGNPYWVDEHDVSRDDWDRSGVPAGFGAAYFAGRLRAIDADLGPTSSFVSPNAKCPVCGDRVYFYQNKWGSRVYFDELGKPWPKHPCIDNPMHRGSATSEGGAQQITPVWRSREEVAIVEDWHLHAQQRPQQDFREKYGVSQWPAFRIVKRLKANRKAFLVLEPVSDPSARRLFLIGEKVPPAVLEGLLVFYYRNWINYMDLQVMEPAEIELRRLAGPAAFVEALIARE